MNPTLVFDIETIPDIVGLRALYELDNAVGDAEVAEMAFQMRRQKTGSDFLPHHLQRVAAISCVLREGDNFKVWSLGELGEDEGSLISRYHSRHLDLMDLLAMYTGRANAPLDELAKLIGFPGKLGMDGSKVWEAYQQGRLAEIRNYCETDVVNTWLVFVRFQLMRGQFTQARYDKELELVRSTLTKSSEPHLAEYLAAWPATKP